MRGKVVQSFLLVVIVTLLSTTLLAFSTPTSAAPLTTVALPTDLKPITPANAAELAQVAAITLKMGSTPLDLAFDAAYAADTVWMQTSITAARSAAVLAMNASGESVLKSGSQFQMFESSSDLYAKKAHTTIDPKLTDTQGFALSPDGTTLALTNGAQITLWDIPDDKVTRTIDTMPPTLDTKIAFSADGSQLILYGAIAYGQDSPVRVVDLATGQITELSGLKGAIDAAAVAPTSQLLAAGSDTDTHIPLWSLADGSLSATLTMNHSGIGALAFSPDERVLAAGGSGGQIDLVDSATHQSITTFTIDGAPAIRFMSFSPDSLLLMSFEVGGPVRFWGTSVDGGPIQTATASAS